jgi:Flp pilus assembly pilin Flp
MQGRCGNMPFSAGDPQESYSRYTSDSESRDDSHVLADSVAVGSFMFVVRRVGGFPVGESRGFPHRQPALPMVSICGGLGSPIRRKRTGRSMKRAMQRLWKAVRSRKGQSLVEYSLVLALIAVVAITVLRGLGRHINNTLSSINANLP